MRHLVIIGVFSLVALAAGCASKSSSGSTAAETGGGSTAPAAAAQPIPPDSPLAKVKIGMTAQEVMNILGAPTNQVGYSTGKAFIPFYFGDDARRTEWSYKGLGRVVFAGGNVFGGGGGRVNRIDYDPSETGIRAN